MVAGRATARSCSSASGGPRVGRALLEIPAGKRDVAGEAPEATAARELEEEIGRRPGRLTLLAEFYNSPGFCDEHTLRVLRHRPRPAARSGARSAPRSTR